MTARFMVGRRGWLGVALCGLLAAGAMAQPTVDEDLGSLANGVTVVRGTSVAANVLHWYSFTVPAVPAGSGPGNVFLDIRTTNPVGGSAVPTHIGLYSSAGTLATGAASSSVDQNQGPGSILNKGSALSYGATCPSRSNDAVAPETVAGAAFNGRDGTLPAGTYYLAVARSTATFGAANWAVTPPTTGTSGGPIEVQILLGTTGDAQPVLSASSATPSVFEPSGGPTVLTMTAVNNCGPVDLPTTVTIDLSPLGGSAAAPMFDDGTNGDASAGDNVWTCATTVGAAPGTYTLAATATNTAGQTTSRSQTIYVKGAALPVKISQVAGAGVTQQSWLGPNVNYVELHNAGASPADLSGYSVQHAGGTGTTWTVTAFPPGFIVPAGGYVLVQLGSSPTTPHSPDNPTNRAGFFLDADVIGNGGGLSSSGGKVALARSQVALVGACPTGGDLIDFVGYGNANCSETSAAPAQSLTSGQVLSRDCTGDTDTGNNAADFALTAAAPRNRDWPVNTGGLSITASPTPADTVNVVQNSAVLITASASGCSGPVSGLVFTVDLSDLDGPGSQPMFDDGTHGDAAAGDGTFSYSYVVPDTVLPNPAPPPTINQPYIARVYASDGQGRAAAGAAAVYVSVAPVGACCAGTSVSVRTAASCAALGGTYRGDNTSPFTGQGVVYNGGAASIPDATASSNGAVSDTIQVPDDTTVREVVVNLYQQDPTTGVTYLPFLGDYSCTLTHNGTTVTLFNRVGVRNSNAVGKPDDLWSARQYRFFEHGSGFWNEAYAGGKDTNYLLQSGYYAPSDLLNAASSFAPFIGNSATGDWTLTFNDHHIGSTGTFAWSLEINPTPGCCIADINHSGEVTVQDIFDFLTFYFSVSPNADVNGSGTVTVQDIFDFLALYFTGC